MNPGKWRDVKYVFNSALQQPPSGLEAFLDQACAGNVELRTEVSRLLREHNAAEGFLESPIARPPCPVDTSLSAVEPIFGRLDRFELRQRLGTGGYGEVFEAFDRERGASVAVKYLRRFDPEQLYRLKKEFRSLADIRHPNLVHVYQLFSGAEPPFFTMELLHGDDVSQYLTAAPRFGTSLDALRIGREYLCQLCKGVIALHESDLLHRDIKPSNVFVTTGGRVVLLDFGLVTDLRGPNSGTTLALAGTPYYIAPEQIDGARLTEATDWYAVGVLLYEWLTGRRPFEGSVLDVLTRKKGEVPVPPSACTPGLPTELDQLCVRLLDRDPAKRPNGYEVLRILQGPGPVVGCDSDRGRVARTFVGREPHVMALQRAFDKTEDGSLVCVHVRGASGVGKTALIKRFLCRMQEARPDCIVLSGRCYESESAPHQGLDELVDHLARYLKRLGPTAAQPLLPRYFGLLARLFPVLQDFKAAGRALPEIPDPREQRHRAFACLRECLVRMSATHPLILWIDDLQWGDEDSVRVLNDLVRSMDPFSCLVILTYRDSDLATNPALCALEADPGSGRTISTILEIETLLYEEARELAAVLVQDACPDEDWRPLADAIARESRGNPYFATELVRYATSIPDRTNLNAGAFGIAHIIKRRIALLPEPALRLLELIAVAGQPVSSEVCLPAVGLGSDFHDLRSRLIREHLLRPHLCDGRDELDLYHDQIREAVVGNLSKEAASVYHGLLADALEATGSTDHERMGVHCEAAGRREPAVRYLVLAARDAVRMLAFDRAARLYRRVLDLGESLPDRQATLEELADALSNAGRGQEAAETFLAASIGGDAGRSLDLRRRACEQYLRSGHVDLGNALSRSLLREVGLPYFERHWVVLASLLWGRLQLRWRGLSVRPGERSGSTGEMRQKLDVCWTIAVGMSMIDVMRSADLQGRFTLMALDSGDPSRVALGLSAELAAGAIDGKRSQERTDALFTRAMSLAREIDDAHATAFALSMRGAVSWLTGKWHDCYERNRVAAGIFCEKCSGVVWELTTANTFCQSSLVFLGRWREHALTLPAFIQQAHERGDRYGAVSLPLLAYAYVDYLASDQPARARALIDESLSAWPDQGFHVQHCDALFGQMETLLYEGDAAAAHALIERTWWRLAASNMLHIQFNRIFATALRGRAALAVAAHSSSRSERARTLRIVKRCVRYLSSVTAAWGIAHGKLLQAGLAMVDGHRAAALDLLTKADALFQAEDMTHYCAATRARLAQLRDQTNTASPFDQPWFRDQGIVNARAIVDMLIPGVWS